MNEETVRELAEQLEKSRQAQRRALEGLAECARQLIRDGGRGIHSEEGFARASGVSRTTVRKWLAKQ